MTLIILILSPLRGLWSGNLIGSVVCALMMLIALGLAGWALAIMRLSNFSIMPEPSTNSALITRGPYRHLRHPMYSAVLLAAFGACVAHQSASKWGLLVALIIVLLLKIRREEKLLCERFSDYQQYKSRTSAIVPGMP
ncbi:MAG: isoprenylcysteine carboxylmethyltransferase family protein [Granulosicoccus sp.]